jgi:hypothetical protein
MKKILTKIADWMQSFDGFEVLALMSAALILFYALLLLAFFL